MDSQTLWLIALSIATPIAGVVGFAVQLNQVKTARLVNEKLALEIASLKAKLATTEERIVRVSTDEVEKYGRVMYSMSDLSAPSPAEVRSVWKTVKEYVFVLVLFSLVGMFFLYFVYDLYRIFMWLRAL